MLEIFNILIKIFPATKNTSDRKKRKKKIGHSHSSVSQLSSCNVKKEELSIPLVFSPTTHSTAPNTATLLDTVRSPPPSSPPSSPLSGRHSPSPPLPTRGAEDTHAPYCSPPPRRIRLARLRGSGIPSLRVLPHRRSPLWLGAADDARCRRRLRRRTLPTPMPHAADIHHRRRRTLPGCGRTRGPSPRWPETPDLLRRTWLSCERAWRSLLLGHPGEVRSRRGGAREHHRPRGTTHSFHWTCRSSTHYANWFHVPRVTLDGACP